MDQPSAQPTASMGEAAATPVTAAYRRYVMILLLCIYIANFIDRQVINILAEPIKLDLKLADWQLGSMTGLAFGLLYTILGIPIARLAETKNRPAIIAISALVWSACTASCGLAGSFLQLIAARVGVGIGEAGCTPSSHSLIVDYAPKEKRGSALATYGMGAPLGGLLGMGIGGLVADAHGWRVAFFLVGIPGVILALITILTLREPRASYKGAPPVVKAAAAGPPLLETLGLLISKRAFCCAIGGMTVWAYIATGCSVFFASFLLRTHGPDLAALAQGAGLQKMGFLGLTLGLLLGVFGALGMWTGGLLSDRFGPADPRRYLRLPAIGALVYAPVMIAALLVPSLIMCLALLAVTAFAGGIYYGPVMTVALSVVPANTRAIASAIALFIANIVSLGLGPFSVGVLSDVFAHGMGAGEGLRWAMAIMSLIVFAAAGLFWYGASAVRDEMAHQEETAWSLFE
jgi:MFS family permease